MDTQGKFVAHVTYTVVGSLDGRNYCDGRLNLSLRLPVFDNLDELFLSLEERLKKYGASDILLEDCKQNGEEVQTMARQNLLIATEFYLSSNYIRILQHMVSVSSEMLEKVTSLEELSNVINWSTSLGTRALGFALEAHNNMSQSGQKPQNLEDNRWSGSEDKPRKIVSRNLTYAC